MAGNMGADGDARHEFETSWALGLDHRAFRQRAGPRPYWRTPRLSPWARTANPVQINKPIAETKSVPIAKVQRMFTCLTPLPAYGVPSLVRGEQCAFRRSRAAA